jgi:Protein of unknown function (DUF2905)
MLVEAGFVESSVHGWTGYRTSSFTQGALASARKASMNGTDGNRGFGWMLVIGGLVIAGIGLIWVIDANLPRLGRLPGDIVIERQNSRFYFPIVTCIVISVVLSLVAWLFRNLMR